MGKNKRKRKTKEKKDSWFILDFKYFIA